MNANMKMRRRVRLHEAATVASVLNDIMELGRKGDEKMRAKVIAQLTKIKNDPSVSQRPEIAALNPSPEMFATQPTQQAAAATGSPAEAGGNKPADNSQPSLDVGGQDAPPPTPAAPVTPPPAEAAAPAPAAAPPPTPPAPTPAPVYNAANPQRISSADYQAALAKAGGNANKVTGSVLDQVVPPGQAPAAATPANAAPTAAAPSPPAQSSFAVASPPPQAQAAAPAAPGAPAATPAATGQAQPAANPTQPAAAKPSTAWNQNVLARRVYQQVAAEIGKPQPNQQQVTQLISGAISQTQIGTPDRQSVVDMIKSLQSNSALRGKMPSLGAIKTETRRTLGRLLREASDPNLLSASELDKICMKVANTLVQTHSVEMPSDSKGGGGSGGDQKTDSNPLRAALGKTIKYQAFADALNNTQMSPNLSNQTTAIEGILKPIQQTTVQDLLNRLDRDQSIRVKSTNLAKEVVALIIKAVRHSV